MLPLPLPPARMPPPLPLPASKPGIKATKLGYNRALVELGSVNAILDRTEIFRLLGELERIAGTL